MELSKDDIKHMAYHRFNKKHTKRFYSIVLGGVALLVGVLWPLTTYKPEVAWLAIVVVIPIAVLLLVSLYFFYNKPQEEYAKFFVEECEINPTLTYVSEATKDAQEAIT